MTSQLKGKVAIVTGSSAGLGEAIAIMFASRGASVTVCGRDVERLRTVLSKAVKASGANKDKFLAVAGDLTDPKVRKDIVEKTVAKFGRLDILVANAGVIGSPFPSLGDTEENFNTVMDTNLKSVFFLIQQAVPHLEKSKGNIVNISSLASQVPYALFTVYCMSKAALDQLTRCLAVDLGPKGIRVNAVNPGHFPTLLARGFPDVEKINKDVGASFKQLQPLKDRVGVFEDVAEAVSFLTSDAAGFITGEFIKVDGGRSYSGTAA